MLHFALRVFLTKLRSLEERKGLTSAKQEKLDSRLNGREALPLLV